MVCAVVLLSFSGIANGQAKDPLVQQYQAARAAEQRADYATATELYQEILKRRPDLAEAHANLGNLHYVQAHYEEARRSFETAIRLKPQLAGPHFFLGVLLFQENNIAEAEKYLDKAASLDPENILIELHRGYTSYAKGRFESAISRFEKVVSSDPKNEDAWYHLSKASSQASRDYFDKLQRNHPDSYFTKLARAHFFEAQSAWAEAAREYTAAAEQKPSSELKAKLEWVQARAAGKQPPFTAASSEIDGSTVLLHQIPSVEELPSLYGKWKDAVRSPQSRAAMTNPREFYTRAEAFQVLSYLSAMSVYANSPDSYRSHQLKAQSLEAAGRTEDAVNEYRKALEMNPQLRSVHFAIGNLFWRDANFDVALPELMAELSINPNDPETHYEVADILLTQGKLEEAAKHYLKSLEFAPKVVEAHLALEKIYNSTGPPEKALFHLKQAVAADSSNPTPHYRLWLLYRKQGKVAEAEHERQIFEKLKAQGPPEASSK